MAASTNPVILQGTVSFPPDEGQTPVPVTFGLSTTYTSDVEARLIMVGAGTTAVPFGTVGSPGAKVMLLEFEADPAAQPVQVKFNGGSETLELSPGGFLAYGSPNPGVGISSLSITRLGDAIVRVRLFG
jgi:hypothetical protein